MHKEQELLQAVLDAREIVSDLDTKLSAAKKVKESAEVALIEQMDNSDVKSFKSDSFNCNVITAQKLYVSIEKDKKEDALRWIEEECGRPDMIKPSIHSSTLTSFIGNRLKNAEAIPQETFKYFFKPILTIRKG